MMLLANPDANKVIRPPIFNSLFFIFYFHISFIFYFYSVNYFRYFFRSFILSHLLFSFFIYFGISSFFRSLFLKHLTLHKFCKALASYVGGSDQRMHVNNFPSTQPCPFSQDCSLFLKSVWWYLYLYLYMANSTTLWSYIYPSKFCLWHQWPIFEIISVNDDYSLLQSHLTIKLCWKLEQFLQLFASHLHAMGNQEFSSKLRWFFCLFRSEEY